MKAALLSLCGVAVLLAPACKPSPGGGGSGEPSAVAGSSSVVKSVAARRVADHVHLMLSLRVKNPDSTAFALTPPAVRVWAGRREVEPFVAPGLEPPVISPGGEAEVETHWWLAASDLSGGITLEMNSSRTEIKSAAAFALDLLPEGGTVSLSFPDWKVR